MYGQNDPGSALQSRDTSARPSAQGSRRQSLRDTQMQFGDQGGGGPGARDVEFDFVIQRAEKDYPPWWTRKRLLQDCLSLGEEPIWNAYICLLSLVGIVWVAVDLKHTTFKALDLLYNISYAIHVFGLAYDQLTKIEAGGLSVYKALGFLIDMFTFSHYVSEVEDFQLLCYYLRLHRPFTYLWALNDRNLKGSVLGTTLKYCYIFLVMRVTWALVWLNIDALEQKYQNASTHRALDVMYSHQGKLGESDDSSARQFLSAVYLVNKMFVPIGPSVHPATDIERIFCMLIMLSGCLMVTASAIASLSLVISLYMRPEESFRTRYRLIIREMENSHILPDLRLKVETFYKMYWHKQKAVSSTQLLPTFPPTIPATIYANIYFEATQKSRILRDLSSQFLSELAKRMETIHFIPGDAIIKRLSKKSTFIYVTYGDIELVTAEDDSTAILRMSRGTVLTPCGVCAPAGFGRSHLEVRAATFCTAHVLDAAVMWRVVAKHGTAEETDIILGSYHDHLESVRNHYKNKIVEQVQYKSSILHFKRCLMALKEAKDAQGNLLLARTDVFLEIAGCYIMRNRADTSLTDESDAICLRSTFPCILQPTSSLQLAWHMFVAFIILTVCFTHPYYLVYRAAVPLEFKFFDYVVTAIFVLDLIIHLSTGANVEEGVPITFVQTSSQQMRSHWFVLDVLGTLPIFEFIGDGHYAGINKILRLPKVFRVLKEIEDSCVYHGNVVRFCSYTLLLLMACYLTAAVQQAFMCNHFGYCVVTHLTESPYWSEMPLDDDTVYTRLIFSLYWAISVIMFTAHMEVWGIEIWNNVAYTMVLLEICIVLRIFMESVYSATILVTTALREDYDATIGIVQNFLIRNQVDPILRQRFIGYLQLTWYTDKAYHLTHKKSIFYDLPRHVFEHIVASQRSKYLLALPFMKYVSKEDLNFMSSRAKLFYVCPNEILLNTGDISNEVYVIKQGICEILSPDTKEGVGLLNVKCHFGVLVCLLRIPAFYTVRAVTHVRVFTISRKYLMAAISTPQFKDALDFSRSTPEFQRLLVRRKPFVKYQPPEAIPNTSRFPLPRKHESDAAFLHPFYRLGFLSILRYIFPRMTIRPDGRYLVRYEWCRAACAFASAMLYPSYTYLSLQFPWIVTVAFFLDLQAYFDICQRMLIGYYNAEGVLVYHPASTSAHYLKGAFMIDLIGCIPLETLEPLKINMGEGNSRLRVSKMSQVLMMTRLLQLYRYPGAIKILHNYIERRDIISILMFFPMFIVILNVVTCFVVLNSATIYKDLELKTLIIEPFDDKEGSWLIKFSNQFRFNITETPWNMQLAAYFWVVYEATTTGYNSLSPSNLGIMRVIFIGMLICAMMITYFSVSIISIRANVNKALAEFQEHMKDMVVYMKREDLSSEIQRDVLDYYEYQWDKMGGVDYRNVFKLCDQITLRTDAILHIYGPTFTRNDLSLLRIVGRSVHSAYFTRGMTIVEANDVISEMYFVDYGGVDVKKTVEDMKLTIKLPRGSVFGNLDGLSNIRCPVTFEATSRAHLLMIDSAVFHLIIKDFPSVTELMERFRPNHDTFYIMGDVADTYHLAQMRSQSASPMVVTSRKGLIKYLYFKDQYIQIYLIIISLVGIYLDIYNAGFQDNRVLVIAILYGLDLAFSIKILLQYTVPLVVDTISIRKVLLPLRRQYFRGEFRYDLLSCIPFEMLCLTSTKNRWLIFSCLRLNRMLRVVTVYSCLRRLLEQITINLILSYTFSVFIWFTLFVHSVSSMWYYIGYLEDQVKENNSWIYKDDGTSWCDNLYICSVYFVLTTFTQNGVGDILPKNQSEVIFVCILQILSTMIYMIYVGEFSNIIQFQSFRSFSFYSKYLELQEFMKNNRVSKNLVTLVNKYALHLWRESRGVQAPHFLLTAPHSMRLRIMSAAYLHHLTRHHIFERCEPAFLRQLAGCLTLMTYNEDMFVVKAREITDSMYLIHKGKIEEIAEEISEEKHKLPRIYPAGSYFGVMQGMIHDLPFTHSYRTLLRSQVLTLRLDDWWYLLKHYPASQEAINQHLGFDGGSSGVSDASGPSSKPGQPPMPPKPPLITKLTDRGSPLTPPRGRANPRKPKFVMHEGPKLSKDDIGPVTVQPGKYPSARRNSFTQETRADGEVTLSSSPTKLSATSIDPREPTIVKLSSDHDVAYVSSENLTKKGTVTLEEDELDTILPSRQHAEYIERPVLNQLLTETSGSDIGRDKIEEITEEHMVTLDIIESKTDVEPIVPKSNVSGYSDTDSEMHMINSLEDFRKYSRDWNPRRLETISPSLDQDSPAFEQISPTSDTNVTSQPKARRKSVSQNNLPGDDYVLSTSKDKVENIATKDKEMSKREQIEFKQKNNKDIAYSNTNILPYATQNAIQKQVKTLAKDIQSKDNMQSNSADLFKIAVEDIPIDYDDITMKDINYMKDEKTSTSKVNRRVIRVRYEDNTTEKRASVESILYPQSTISQSSPSLVENQKTKDGDLRQETDIREDDMRSKSSNVTVASSIESIRTLRKKKTK